MELTPMTLGEANDFVEQFHRHNKRTHAARFAIGLMEGELVGVAIVGNPLSATFMDGKTAEVLRLCTNDKAPKNACSKLYGACWRAWKAMGGRRIVTYTLQEESGSSLKGAGWTVIAESKPHDSWRGKNKQDNGNREWQPIYGQLKFRWEMNL
jgi:hypothetical protein